MVDVRYYDIGDVPYGYQEVSMNKEAIVSSRAPAALGPYSSAVKVGDTLYLSGQLGLDPMTNELKDGVEAQAEQALTNVFDNV